MNEIDFRDILLTIVGLVCAALVIVCFAGCTGPRVVTVVEQRDSIRTEYRTDSLYFYEKDSVFIKQSGDTVYIDKWHLRFRDVARTDTVVSVREVEKPVIQEVVTERRYIPRWVWWLVGANCLLVVAGAVKLYLKFKPI